MPKYDFEWSYYVAPNTVGVVDFGDDSKALVLLNDKKELIGSVGFSSWEWLGFIASLLNFYKRK